MIIINASKKYYMPKSNTNISVPEKGEEEIDKTCFYCETAVTKKIRMQIIPKQTYRKRRGVDG